MALTSEEGRLTSEEGRMLGAFKKEARNAAFGKLKHSRMAVYRALVDCIHWPDRTAYKSRSTICKETGLTEGTVKLALSELRKRGWIDAVAYGRGGRGKSPVYKFPIAENRGENDTRIQGVNTPKQGRNSYVNRYEKNTPYNSSSKYKKASPSRGQGDKPREFTEAAMQRTLRIGELCKLHEYGEAMRIFEREQAENESEGRQA